MNLRSLMEECADKTLSGAATGDSLAWRLNRLSDDDHARVVAFVKGARYGQGKRSEPKIMPAFYRKAKREAPYMIGGLVFTASILLIVGVFTLRITPARAAEASPPSSAEAASAPEGR